VCYMALLLIGECFSCWLLSFPWKLDFVMRSCFMSAWLVFRILVCTIINAITLLFDVGL